MPALHTQRDRQIYSLRREIERVEGWLSAEMSNRRAAAFHKAKLAELRAELTELEEKQS